VQGEKLNDTIVDFHLELVDGVFFLEDALGELFIGFQNGVNGLVTARSARLPIQSRRSFISSDLFRSGVPMESSVRAVEIQFSASAGSVHEILFSRAGILDQRSSPDRFRMNSLKT